MLHADGHFTNTKGRIEAVVLRDGRQLDAIRMFAIHYNEKRDATGWANLSLKQISADAGMNENWAGVQVGIWRRIQPHPWIERTNLAREDKVTVRFTPAGVKALAKHGVHIDLPEVGPRFDPEPKPEPAVAPTVVATPQPSLLQQLCMEIEDLLTHPAGVVTCDHEAELAELDALRQWRDTVLATKP